jgi:hypothetical protein
VTREQAERALSVVALVLHRADVHPQTEFLSVGEARVTEEDRRKIARGIERKFGNGFTFPLFVEDKWITVSDVLMSTWVVLERQEMAA